MHKKYKLSSISRIGRFIVVFLIAGFSRWTSAAPTELTSSPWPPTAMAAKKSLKALPSTRPADLKPDDNVRLSWILSRYHSDHSGAMQAAQAALKADPKNYKAHEIAGLIHEMRGEYEQAFNDYLALLSTDRPESEIYLHRIDELNPTRSQRDAVRDRIAAGIADRAVGEPYRARLRLSLADDQISRGDLRAAAQTFAQLGFVQDWMLIGPFDNERNAGYNQAYGPENEINYDAEYQGRDRKVKWSRLAHTELSGLISFFDVMYPHENVLAYALTYIQSPRDENIVLRVGAANAVKLWLNDALLLADDQNKNFYIDQYDLPARLHAGWNKLLVKVCERNGQWRLDVRVTRPDGSLLVSADRAVVAARTEPLPIRKTPHATSQPASSFDYAGSAHDVFERRLKARPDDPETLCYFGQCQSITGRKERAGATLERLVEQNPKCSEHHYLLADAYSDDEKPDKELASLKKALEIEPGYAEARLRLALFYRYTQKPDEALSVVNEVVAAHPDWPDAHGGRLQVYRSRHWSEQVLREATWLLKHKPDVPWAVRTYADVVHELGYRDEARQQYQAAVTLDYDLSAARRRLIDLAEERNDIREALAQYEILKKLMPSSIDLRLQIARFQLRNKRFDDALVSCDDALRICAENSSAHHMRGTILERLHRDDDALAAWKLALKYNPDDRALRDYIEFRQPQSAAAFDRFGLSAKDAAAIVRGRVKPSDYPKADAVELLDHLVIQLNEDGSYTSLEHRIIQILNENGREAFTSVPLSGGAPKVKRAVVIQENGHEVEATSIGRDAIAFGQLQIGTVVEYKVQYRGSSNEWLSRHFATTFGFQGRNPEKLAEFILLVPPTRKIRHALQGKLAKLSRSKFEGNEVYDFRAEDVPMIEPERNRPPVPDIAERVMVSTIDDWNEITRWEHALTKDAFTPDEALRRRTAELTRGVSDRESRIRAIANFVCQKVQYRQDYERPILGMEPHKAGTVLVKEAGDCKDKATLLITMLREAGIPANYVTLRTRGAGRLIEDIPSNQCNHAIVFVPEPGDFSKGRFIDGTSEEAGVDTLPWQDQGCRVMVFRDDGTALFRDTPVDKPDANKDDLQLDVRLKADGAARVRARWHATGQWASFLRAGFKAPGMRPRIIEQFANSLFAGARITKTKFSDLQNRDIPVDIEFSFDAPNVAQAADSQLILRPRSFFDMTRRYADRTERHYPLWFGFNHETTYAERYHAPKGYRVGRVPESAKSSNHWADFEHTARHDEDTIAFEKTVRFKSLTVPLADYDEWRKFCVEVDRVEREEVTFDRISRGNDDAPEKPG